MSAKRGELINAGIRDPLPHAIQKAIKKNELAHHCRWRTRGATETAILIEAVLLEMTLATDANGAPLLSQEMMSIWEEQKKHLVFAGSPRCLIIHHDWERLQGWSYISSVMLCKRYHLIDLHIARYN